MKRVFIALGFSVVLVIAFVVTFQVYGQFALDYSLDSLKQALEAPGRQIPAELGSSIYSASLETMVLDELAQPNADLKSVVLLEHAARSVREALGESDQARAGVYLSEVLKTKSEERNLFLRIADSLYYFSRNLIRAVQNLLDYLVRRMRIEPVESSLRGAGVLLLGEAARMEQIWKLEDARRYYEEFLRRYPGRPENGFVTISLAHVLIKMGRLEEAKKLLGEVQHRYPTGAEETAALRLLKRVDEMVKQRTRIPALEESVREDPALLFRDEGGLQLGLLYLATYQVKPALSILKKLEEAPDPRVRNKALFYQGWILKWQGDFEKGREILELLQGQLEVEQDLVMAAEAELADLFYENKQYEKAVESYRSISREEAASTEALRALPQLEEGQIYLFELNRLKDVQELLRRIEVVLPTASPFLIRAKQRLEAALSQTVRDRAFLALSETRVDEAKDLFLKYLLQFPRDGIARSGLASTYLLRGDLEKAMDEAQKGYGLARDEYTASILGYVHEKSGDVDEAGQYYRIALTLQPAYLVAQFNLARIYVATGQWEKALGLLRELEKKSRKLSPAVRAKVLNNLGAVLWTSGSEKEGIRLFKEALELKPDLSEAEENLRLIFSQEMFPAPSRG